MTQRYVAFDVETPNARCDRMSAIGVTVIEDGKIVREFSSLINPDTHFDQFNIELTGIAPRDVQDAPNFSQLWPTLEHLFDDSLLVAHNAPFDLCVLGRCLNAYGIIWRQTVDYVCTCQMSRSCLPNFPNYRLNTICDCLGIALEHHHAESDSRACAEILLTCLSRGAQLSHFRRTYNLRTLHTVRTCAP